MPHPPSALDIARALIAFPSVTPADAGALPYLRDLLAGAGFSAELVTFSEAGTPDVLNLYARFGATAPNFVFAGHTDVVPPGDAAALAVRAVRGRGRRGPALGTRRLRHEGRARGRRRRRRCGSSRSGAFPGSISFLVTGDEEGPSINGTVKLIRWALDRGERFDHCIVGEPTSVETLGDTIKHGRRGSLTGRLTLHGRQGHVAYPHIADNPVRALAPVLAALFDPPLDDGDADFDPSNLEVVSVDVGNPASNVIPAEVRLLFNVRFNAPLDARDAEGGDRPARRGRGRRASYARLRSDQRGRLPDPARGLHRPRRRRGRGRHRAAPRAFDQRRHVRRPLHQGRLPGRRPRPAERDHSRGRRAGRARRSRGPVAHLRAGAGAVFRRVLL